MTKLAWTVLASSLAASPAVADVDDAAAPHVITGDLRSPRGVSEDWMIMPQGLELGSELKFITATGGLGAAPLAFTDVAVLSLHARRSLAPRAEVYASVDVLPKQPSWSDEPIWQGASLGLRAQVGRTPAAFGLRASGGPMLGDLGLWGQGLARFEARKRIHRTLSFEGSASAAATYLAPRGAAAPAPAWLVEAAVGGSALFRDPHGFVGGWLGVGYALPVAHRGRDPLTAAALDPQPRLDLHVGGVVTVEDQWDLFIDYAVVDRGEMSAMATRLPILDGGFDQRQIIIGLNYHPRAAQLSAAMIMH